MSDFKPKKKGDTWNGLKIEIEDNESYYDFTNSTARIHFRREQKNGSLTFSYSTEEGTLLREGNTFFMTPRRLDYPAANYFFDLEVTFQDGYRKTFFENQIKIVQDVSF